MLVAKNIRLAHYFHRVKISMSLPNFPAALLLRTAAKASEADANLILSLVDVNRADDCECFLSFDIERPRFVYLGFQPIPHRSMLAFK